MPPADGREADTVVLAGAAGKQAGGAKQDEIRLASDRLTLHAGGNDAGGWP